MQNSYKLINANTDKIVVGLFHKQTLSDCIDAIRLILGADATVKQAINAGYYIVKS